MSPRDDVGGRGATLDDPGTSVGESTTEPSPSALPPTSRHPPGPGSAVVGDFAPTEGPRPGHPRGRALLSIPCPRMQVPPRARRRVALAVLLLAVPTCLTLGIGLGAVPIPLGTVWQVLVGHLPGVDPTASALDDQIVWEVRTPRVLLAMVVGAGLAVAGTVLQAVVRNPLADPYVLGVSAGASLAAVSVLTLVGVGGTGVLAAAGVSGAAFAGGVASLAVVVALARRRTGGVDPARLLLAGVALAYLCQALTSWLQLRSDPTELSAVLFWLLGTVAGATWDSLGVPTLVVVTCTAWLVTRRRALNALLAGDETAASLGLDVGRLRLQLLAVAAALTAAVISVAGGVGFVGLVAPHCVRLVLGADHRRVLPAAALLGGVFLVLADLAGRLVAQPLELPLSVVTSLAGVPFFLVLLRRSGRGEPGRG